jgi:hypothetical protein
VRFSSRSLAQDRALLNIASLRRSSVPYSVPDLADAYARESSQASHPAVAALPHGSPLQREAISPDSSRDVASSAATDPAFTVDKPALRPLDLVAAASSVPPSMSAASPADSASPSRGSPSTPRGDAKARAAAFIADLKRAKAAAAASASSSAGEESAGEETEATAEKDSASVAAQHVLGDSPSLPVLPFEARPASPLLPLGQPDFTRSAASPVAPDRSPPPRPTSNTKRPSDSSDHRRQSTVYSPLSHSESFSSPLYRRRPLPPALQIAGELRRARTAGERARIYAEKINQLAREKSRLDEWIASTRDVRTAVGRCERYPLILQLADE